MNRLFFVLLMCLSTCAFAQNDTGELGFLDTLIHTQFNGIEGSYKFSGFISEDSSGTAVKQDILYVHQQGGGRYYRVTKFYFPNGKVKSDVLLDFKSTNKAKSKELYYRIDGTLEKKILKSASRKKNLTASADELDWESDEFYYDLKGKLIKE